MREESVKHDTFKNKMYEFILLFSLCDCIHGVLQ